MEKSEKEVPLITAVDDEMYDELSALVGQRIVHIAVWEDSLADALAEHTVDAARQTTFDIDLYLEDGVYFELYGVTCFDDPDAEPWKGLEQAESRMAPLVTAHARLSDVAVDEEDALILIVERAKGVAVYLVISAWLLAEWDELPDS